MDFVRYAEAAAALVSADPGSIVELVELLEGRGWLQDQVTESDVRALRTFVGRLRPVFEAADADDVDRVVSDLNALLARHPITPMISDHDPTDLHLHVANRSSSVADLLVSEALLGLATVVCDLGPSRLGVCSDAKCATVYVDTSPNRSRRYCSDRCSSRANVAAFRARQKASTGA